MLRPDVRVESLAEATPHLLRALSVRDVLLDLDNEIHFPRPLYVKRVIDAGQITHIKAYVDDGTHNAGHPSCSLQCRLLGMWKGGANNDSTEPL